ncbi:MAG: hypothetical protein EHM48_01175 [Planctomycetaceae bacterium]|nr:MAG: hypothetical protein EHM48_01175 [Planctomycetaceae bacterium]
MMVAKKYTVEWRDANGKVHRQTGFTDRAESWSLAQKLEADAQAVQTVKHRKTPMSEHLEAFKRSLQAKERTAKHVRITNNRIKSLFVSGGQELNHFAGQRGSWRAVVGGGRPA